MLKLLSDWHCVDAAISCDRFGRLAETAAGFGSKVTYAYDSKGRLARQTVDGTPIDYAYTKYGQLAGKYLGGREKPDAAISSSSRSSLAKPPPVPPRVKAGRSTTG